MLILCSIENWSMWFLSCWGVWVIIFSPECCLQSFFWGSRPRYALVTVSMKRSIVGGFEHFLYFAAKEIFKGEVSLLLKGVVLALTKNDWQIKEFIKHCIPLTKWVKCQDVKHILPSLLLAAAIKQPPPPQKTKKTKKNSDYDLLVHIFGLALPNCDLLSLLQQLTPTQRPAHHHGSLLPSGQRRHLPGSNLVVQRSV